MEFETAMRATQRSRAARLINHPFRLARRKLTNHPKQVQTRTFWGDSMTVVLPEEVSCRIYEFGIWEPGLTRLLIDRIRPGWVLFDVGAHFGYFSLLSSHLGAKVHAFEPTPTTCKMLRSNVGDRVSVNEVALWNANGSVPITDFGVVKSAFNTVGKTNNLTDKTAAHTVIQVPATTIDDYVARTGAVPHLIKLDVERVEEQVVDGAHRTLANHKPLVTVEVGEGEESRRLLHQMAEMGYRPFDITIEGVSPHSLRSSYTYDNLLLVHGSM